MKIIFLYLLIIVNIQTILGSNCRFIDPLRNQTYDLRSVFKKNNKHYFTTGNSTHGYNGEHFSVNFNLCDCYDYSYCKGSSSPSSVCQYFYDEYSFKGIFDLGSFSNIEYHDDGFSIVYRSIVFDPDGYNDCSGAVDKNRRVTYFNFLCDPSIDIINTNKIIPIQDGICKYQISFKSKSFCTTSTTTNNDENQCSKSHTIYYDSVNNTCECDSQSTGKRCEISKMFISSISYVQESGGLILLNGYFGNEYEKSNFNIKVGDENCRNVLQLSENLITCDIGPGAGFKNVYLEDRGLSIFKTNQLQYISNTNGNSNNDNNNHSYNSNKNSSKSSLSSYKIEIIVLACVIVTSILIMLFTYRFIKKRQEKLKIDKIQQLNNKEITIS
ncbi:hypothetical protein ACTFIV_009258 [Dictyostelium citrinum]